MTSCATGLPCRSMATLNSFHSSAHAVVFTIRGIKYPEFRQILSERIKLPAQVLMLKGPQWSHAIVWPGRTASCSAAPLPPVKLARLDLPFAQ